MTKELLQQCLDALIESRDDVDLCYAGVKAARLSFREERQLGFYEEQLVKHDAAIEGLKQALAQQEQPASVDAYVGAREDAAIWKKRALEAEGLNRKFIAEVNGPTYLGEPVKQEQPAQEPVSTEDMASAYLEKHLWKVIDMAGMWPKAKIDTRTWQHAMVYAPTQPALSDDEILNCFYASKSEGMVAYMLAVGRAIEAHCRGGADK